jgi:Cu/Ag efflux protein CusF
MQLRVFSAVVSSLAASIALASPGLHPLAEPSPPQLIVAQAATNAMADGEVRKVDKDAKKITVKHGEIKNLNMPPMTMVFQVKDPAMLDQVKQGDQIRFEAEQVNGALVISKVEPVK